MSQTSGKFDPHNLRGHYAGFITRLTAFLIDIFIISVLYAIVAIAIQAIGDFFQYDLLAALNKRTTVSISITILSALFPVAYFTVFWSLTGQTPGKAFIGVRIYTLDGNRLSLRRALLRYASYWLSMSIFFGGFLMVLVDKRRQTLHDKIARTVVVYDWEARIHRRVTERMRRSTPPRS